MMLSIEVLPAPFGPMMARISPWRMSNETPVTALTPPNANETLSTESSTSRAATSGPLGALTLLLQNLPCNARSRRALQRGQAGHGPDIADFQPRGKHALPAVLECHFCCDVGLSGAEVERAHQRGVTLGDETAPNLLRPRDLAVIGVELLVQDEEAADLGARHCLLGRERPVHLLDVLRQHVIDQWMSGKLLI